MKRGIEKIWQEDRDQEDEKQRLEIIRVIKSTGK
jgi:hypothetical protein